jgi:hypothetical protein
VDSALIEVSSIEAKAILFDNSRVARPVVLQASEE